nr:CoA pyrophosphatase [Tomitella cavernea]
MPRVLQSRAVPPGVRARPASVLMLFGDDASGHESDGVQGGDVLLTQRAATLRHHSGQVAFPGGAADPGDGGPVQTALREAEEETGLRPDGVQPLAVMPELFVPPSKFLVSPVLAYWREPCPIRVVDEAETSRVTRVPVADLVDPANRFQVQYRQVFTGPAFMVDGMLVWGFTAGLLSALITEAGWEREWDTGDIRELDITLAEVDEQATRR